MVAARKTYDHYLLFAELLRYPEARYPELAKATLENVRLQYPELVSGLEPFVNWMNSHNEDERAELYTKTFDVQPICYLDLGYVIFGEDYKRGAFLLHMQQEQQKAGNDCGTDLPDNISNMLVLYTKTDDQALKDELAVKILIPGLEKMIAEFNQARVDLKIKVLKKLHRAIIQEELNIGNVYRNVFETLLAIIREDFKDVPLAVVNDNGFNMQHHSTFFQKHSVNQDVNTIVNNYKLD